MKYAFMLFLFLLSSCASTKRQVAQLVPPQDYLVVKCPTKTIALVKKLLAEASTGYGATGVAYEVSLTNSEPLVCHDGEAHGAEVLVTGDLRINFKNPRINKLKALSIGSLNFSNDKLVSMVGYAEFDGINILEVLQAGHR